MASSKGDAKPRKIVDVVGPGKTAPPATARPVIVTNRPMLKRDPMMASPDGLDKPDESPARISRVAKPINVLDSEPTPVTESEATPAAPAESSVPAAPPAKSTGKPIKPITITHADQDVAMEVGKEALASLEDGNEEAAGAEAAAAKLTPDASSSGVPIIPIDVSSEPSKETPARPEEPTHIAVTVSVPTTEGETPSSTGKPATPVEKPADVPDVQMPEPNNTGEPAQTIASTPTSTSTTPETEPETKPEPESTPDEVDSTDEQLPASQVLEDEKRKKEEEAAQLVAEQEKIIASKRYYLPIQKRGRKRGVVRAMLALVLVLLLSLIWLDVVLDAGIVHIPGLHALTNFFK